MKKRLLLLKMIDTAGKLAFAFLLFFCMYLASALAEGEINLMVTVAACGGIYAVGKWLYCFLPELEELIEKLEAAIERKEARERAAAYELRIVRDIRPGV